MANNNVNGSIGRSDEFCRISKSYGNKYETSIDRDSIDKLLNVKYKYTMVEISKNAVISTICLMNLLISVMIWMGDIIKKGRRGQHTMKVKENLTIGFILFIINEVIIYYSLYIFII